MHIMAYDYVEPGITDSKKADSSLWKAAGFSIRPRAHSPHFIHTTGTSTQKVRDQLPPLPAAHLSPHLETSATGQPDA